MVCFNVRIIDNTDFLIRIGRFKSQGDTRLASKSVKAAFTCIMTGEIHTSV